MSASGPSSPAGWYPDPEDPARGRYWNGVAWTEFFHTPGQPYPAGAVPKAPPGTDGNTPWVWLIVFLPLLPMGMQLFVPWGSMFDVDLSSRTMYSAMPGMAAVLLSPFYWGSIVVSYVIYGLSVFFAYRDVKELTARGVPRPFHWAFAFIGGVVYAIGRSVVVARRTGAGHAPIWVEAGVIVLSFVITGWILAVMLGGMTELVASLPGSYR